MNGNDTNDRVIDEALRLTASGQPPAGYLDRLQRRIEAVPEARPVRGGLWLWVPVGCAAAAILFAILLHKPEPVPMAVAPIHAFVPRQLAAHPMLLSSRNEELASNANVHVLRAGNRHRKNIGVATRDAANLFNYPLTHQERLLLQFARTAKPADLQTLNPEYQARLEAQQEAEFTAYLRSVDDSEDSSSYSTASKNSRSNQTTQE